MTDPTPPSVPSDSILEGVKVSLGIMPDDDSFDQLLIMHVNSAFGVLQQLGVGPKSGFSIVDESAVWATFEPDPLVRGLAKQEIHFRVRLGFDPPATSFAITSTENLLKELDWRLVSAVEGRAT